MQYIISTEGPGLNVATICKIEMKCSLIYDKLFNKGPVAKHSGEEFYRARFQHIFFSIFLSPIFFVPT